MPPNTYESYLGRLLATAGICDPKLPPGNLFKLLSPGGDRADSTGASARSALNNNGVPVQFIVSTGRHPVRVLADIAYDVPSQRQRLKAGLKTAEALALRLGFGHSLPGLQSLLRSMLPPTLAALEEMEHGAIWLAVGYGACGADRLSIYTNGDWGTDPYAHWLRPFRLLTRLGCEGSATWLRTLLPRWIDRIAPAGSALDYDAGGINAIKLYFRTTAMQANLIDDLLAPVLAGASDQVFHAFADQLFPERDLPRGTFIALRFKLGSQTVNGIKVDACAHCMGYDDDELAHRWTQFAHDLRIDNSIYPQAVALFSGDRTSGLHHANLGVGIGEGHLSLDAYFRPGTGGYLHSCADATLRQSLQAGIDFLLHQQQADGHWEDFALPVGASDAWVTAVIGRCLTAAQAVVTDARLEAATARAAKWLLANENRSGGWGYNASVPVDSDSTAHAAIFLMATAAPSNHLAEVLIRFQRPDGGFATYQEEHASGAWVLSHPDVTPVVALALAGLLGDDLGSVRRALAYCRRNIRSDGSMPSYWWRSEFYTPAMTAIFFAQINESLPNHFVTGCPPPETSLDAALAVMVSACVRAAPTATLDALIQGQRCDGSWPSSPQLCVTPPECREPWVRPEGHARCFCDNTCLFTTAIAVHALALVLAKLSEGVSPMKAG